MNSLTRFTTMDSPFGQILVAGNLTGLSHISFLDGDHPLAPGESWREDEAFFADAISQLDAYLRGVRTTFDLQLAPRGTAFQERVWQAVRAIPYGRTAAYAQLACQLGQPKAPRAIGAANGRNPLPIVIPCHRVIGSNGALTGYRAGLSFKQKLLELERQMLSQSTQGKFSRQFNTDLI